MADTQIHGFTEATSLNSNDEFVIQRSTSNFRVLYSTLLANFRKCEVALSGILVGTRKRVNFIPTGNATLSIVDNSGSDCIDVTMGVQVIVSPTAPTNKYAGMLWLDTSS